MARRTQPAPMATVVAAWALIWIGVILAVNPSPSVAQAGAGLWAAGVLVQYVVGVRWLVGRSSSHQRTPS